MAPLSSLCICPGYLTFPPGTWRACPHPTSGLSPALHWWTTSFPCLLGTQLCRHPEFNMAQVELPTSLLECKEIKPSILKEISPEYSLERLMLKLKLQYLGSLMGRAQSLEETLTLEKTEGGRSREQQRMRWLDNITDLMDINLNKLLEIQ